MGAFTQLDPATIKCMPGKCVVKIVEVLGGQTKGGLWKPASYAGHMGKDTFYGEFFSVGPAPELVHYKSGDGPGMDVKVNKSGDRWDPEIMAQFQVGDIGVFPRDVELIFVWEDARYGICYLHEALFVVAKDGFDAQGIEVLPWTPPSLPQ